MGLAGEMVALNLVEIGILMMFDCFDPKDGGILPKLVGLRTGFYLWLNFERII